LLDLVSDAAEFADCVGLVRGGGVALTTNYVADEKALSKSNVRGGNFMLGANSGLLERLLKSAGNGTLKIAIEMRVPFDEAIAAIATARIGHARGKTVIMI
jgi:NADPH:quinone reductase-like Zn-dependent oxidoreductase